MFDIVLVTKLLILLASANGAPVIASRIMGDTLSRPLDGGLILNDGRPLFGKSKTIRGIVASVAVTAIVAPVIGMTVSTGALIAGLAMAGDLLSSFIKRRRGLAASARATGLDQIPESLIPALAGMAWLGLGVLDVLAIVIAFFFAVILMSRLLFKLNIRKHPY